MWLGTWSWQKRTEERRRLFSSQKQIPLMLRVGGKGDSREYINPEWPYWNLSQMKHTGSSAWLQKDRIFGQDKGCSRSQADIWVLIRVGFYIIYVFILTTRDVPRAAERWQACTALNMLLISIWQDTVLPRDFSSHQLTALSFVLQQSWKFSAKAEAPLLVGACPVWTWTTPPGSKWLHV